MITLPLSRSTNAQLLATIAWTLGLAVVRAEAIQRPLVERVGRVTVPRRTGHTLSVPHVPRAGRSALQEPIPLA